VTAGRAAGRLDGGGARRAAEAWSLPWSHPEPESSQASTPHQIHVTLMDPNGPLRPPSDVHNCLCKDLSDFLLRARTAAVLAWACGRPSSSSSVSVCALMLIQPSVCIPPTHQHPSLTIHPPLNIYPLTKTHPHTQTHTHRHTHTQTS
jgi:hypothetical protein